MEHKIEQYHIKEKPPVQNYSAKNPQLEPYSHRICYHEDFIYFMANGKLYFLNLQNQQNQQYKWQVDNVVPFSMRYGQSMTASSQGIVFFGGYEMPDVYYNDIWIFNKDTKFKWSYIVCDIPPRAFHAATSTNSGTNIVISGGKHKDKIFDDFYILNLETQSVQKVEFSINFPFYNHSMVPVSKSEICLLGGFNISEKSNFEIYRINTETKAIDLLDTEYHNQYLNFSNCSYCFDLLFTTPGIISKQQNSQDYNNVMMFHFEHKTWIPLNLSMFPDFNPYFVYQNIHQPNYLFIINQQLSTLIRYMIFSKPNFIFSADHLDYTTFLRNSLIYANHRFSRVNSQYTNQIRDEKRIIEETKGKLSKLVIDNDLITSDEIESIHSDKNSLEAAKSIEAKSLEIAKKVIQKSEKAKSDENIENIDLHQTISSMLTKKQEYKETINNLTKEAEMLSEKIAKISFFSASFANHKIPSTQTNQTFCASQQIASKIKNIKSEIAKLESIYQQKNKENQNVKNSILNNYDQIWQVQKFINNTTHKICDLKHKYFSTLRNLFELRVSELKTKSIDDKMKAITLDSITIPEKMKKTSALIQEKIGIINEINDSLDALMTTSKGCDAFAIDRVNRSIQALESWTVSSIKILPSNNSLKPLILRRVKKSSGRGSRAERSIPPPAPETRFVKRTPPSSINMTSLALSIGRLDLLANDIERVLNRIDEELNEKN